MVMAESSTPLLEKVYYDNCPGCKLDRRKESNPGIPYREFLYVWLVTLCSALPISSLFPFLYFMIRDLHIAKRDEDIGFYAGFVGCGSHPAVYGRWEFGLNELLETMDGCMGGASFMLGRALTSVFWGVVADRYGRKCVIIVGIIAVIIFNTLFGLSTSYWMAIITRSLLGILSGVLGAIRAYASEVCPEEHQALGLSLVSTAWGIGLVIGPAMGGFFAQPAEKFPNIFSKESFFGRFPYFLPCLCISLFAVIVLISCIWLPETLHTHNENKMRDRTSEDLEASSCTSDLKDNYEATEERYPASDGSLFMNWPLMSSIFVYCIFSLHDMAYTEIFPLWAESDRKYGGLSFSTQDVGEVLAITGSCLLVFQLFVYPPVNKTFGPIISARVAAVLSIPLLASFPFMSKLSGLILASVVNCASLAKNILAVTRITGMFILQNNAVPQHQRGAANGISMTGMSLFKAVGPAAGGAILSWAQKRQHASFLPGDHMVFFMLNVVEFIGIVLTFKPFLKLPGK